jgi:hypothetical protein
MGLLMRYKIGFELHFLNQKYMQHAHSHFAFSAWVSQMLMVLMSAILQRNFGNQKVVPYQYILWANFISAAGMLVSFSIQGYGFVSILFSTVNLFASLAFCILYLKDLQQVSAQNYTSWLRSALIFNLLSALGTFSLVIMEATEHAPQKLYLSSVYWYLHFQYNGWFTFGCIGVFLEYLSRRVPEYRLSKKAFYLFAFSCLPAFGLSELWLHVPAWLYWIIAAAAVLQLVAWILILRSMHYSTFMRLPDAPGLTILLFRYLAVAMTIKLLLQLGSVIPEVSQWAYGYRIIVLAYLHLVLLAVISVFLIAFAYVNFDFHHNRLTKTGILIFISAVFLTEFTLAIQGVGIMYKEAMPWVYEALFVIALGIVAGIVWMVRGQIEHKKGKENLYHLTGLEHER